MPTTAAPQRGLCVGDDCAADTNECATKCMGEDMECKDTYGSFECTCTDGGLYDSENDVCLGTPARSSNPLP